MKYKNRLILGHVIASIVMAPIWAVMIIGFIANKDLVASLIIVTLLYATVYGYQGIVAKVSGKSLQERLRIAKGY